MFMRTLPAALAVLGLAGATPVRAQDPPPASATRPAESSSARPAELVKLEAQAATEIPVPPVPAGRAPEARKAAETAVAVRRAQWVVEKLLPPAPEGVSMLDFATLKVGSRGWVDLTGEVTKIHEGVAVVRPGLTVDGVTFAVPASNDARTVTLRGEYVADRATTIDGKEILVLREVQAAPALDPARAAVLDAARKRLEEARAEHARAVGVVRELRAKAEQEVTQRARAAAEKQVVIPKDADVEEQVRLRARQQELAIKLAKEELDKITTLYGDIGTTTGGGTGAGATGTGAGAAGTGSGGTGTVGGAAGTVGGTTGTGTGVRKTDPGIPPPQKTAPRPIGNPDPIKK